MRVQLVTKENAPDRLVGEAELIFDDVGPLTGMKRVRLSQWHSPEGEDYVTFPSRVLGRARSAATSTICDRRKADRAG